jgi:hypothetical protein
MMTNYEPIVRKNNYTHNVNTNNNNSSGSQINGFVNMNLNNNHYANLRGNETERHSLTTSINFHDNFHSIKNGNVMSNNSAVISNVNNSTINQMNSIKPRESY